MSLGWLSNWCEDSEDQTSYCLENNWYRWCSAWSWLSKTCVSSIYWSMLRDIWGFIWLLNENCETEASKPMISLRHVQAVCKTDRARCRAAFLAALWTVITLLLYKTVLCGLLLAVTQDRLCTDACIHVRKALPCLCKTADNPDSCQSWIMKLRSLRSHCQSSFSLDQCCVNVVSVATYEKSRFENSMDPRSKPDSDLQHSSFGSPSISVLKISTRKSLHVSSW